MLRFYVSNDAGSSMAEVFFAVFPVFMILGVGMTLDRLHVLPESFAGQLSQYVFKLAMPCLLFRLVARAELSFASTGGFLCGMLAAQMLVFGGAYVWLSRGRDTGGAFTAMLALAGACSNSGFLGLPIIDSLLPGNHDALVAAGLACIMPPLVLVCAQSIIEMQNRATDGTRVSRIIVRAVVCNPFVIAAALGAVLSVSGFGIWTPADRCLALIGSTGAPCALIALGLDMWRKMHIARRAASPHRMQWQSGIAFIKLCVHPLLAWGLMALFGVPDIWLAVGVLMSGTSTAVMAYVLAEVTRVIPEECALAVVITAFLSMLTIPLFALALRAAGYMSRGVGA